MRALKEKTTPEVLAEKVHAELKLLFNKYNCTFTYYGKTHTEQNRETVYEIFKALDKNSYITEVESTMPYCNNDRLYLADTLVEGKCPYCGYAHAKGNQCENCGKLLDPNQLIGLYCVICKKNDIVFKKVKHLALLLNKMQDKIAGFIEKQSKEHWSKNAANKSITFVKEGLRPRDITRNTKWGFPVPKKGFEEQNFYVWFDAPIAYIGITREWDAKRWQDYWKSNDTKTIYFMGKDNIEFHTVMWPGLLIGSNLGFTLPTTIRASEYLLTAGMKFSKSQQRGLNMQEALGVLPADYWRFILMYLYPETADTDLTDELIVQIVNGIMNDNIGNFINRVLKLIYENKGTAKINMAASPGTKEAKKAIERYTRAFDNFELREALQSAIELSSVGNSIMGNSTPWLTAKAAKSDARMAEKFSAQMSELLSIVYRLGILLWPFTPQKSMEILSYFNVNDTPKLSMLDKMPVFDGEKEVKPLFKKVEESALP